MSRIVEQCGCGARIEFDKRPAPKYHEQDEADQEFLRQFRNEHTCPLRASSPGNVECLSERPGGCGLAAPWERPRPECPDCTPENVEPPCDYCGNGYPDAPFIQNCPKCRPGNVEEP